MSISLSKISLTMHPADLIKTEPIKNSIKYLKYKKLLLENSKPMVNPHAQGQKSNIKPMGFCNLVKSKNNLKYSIIIYL